MGIREDLADQYDEPELLFMDGYDDAIIGVCKQYGRENVVAYSYEKVLEITMQDDATLEEAIEHFEYNQIGGYVGEKTPVFIETIGG